MAAIKHRTRALKPVVQGAHYCHVWDGKRMVTVYVKTEFP